MLLPGLEQTIPGHGDILALRHTRTETKELKALKSLCRSGTKPCVEKKTSPVSSISLTEPGPAHYLAMACSA